MEFETFPLTLYSKGNSIEENNTIMLFSFYRINGHLGSGQFGFVEKGVWRDGTKMIPVALKLLKHGSSETDKVKFLKEAAIMAQFKHPNVVSLYGVVSNGESVSNDSTCISYIIQ